MPELIKFKDYTLGQDLITKEFAPAICLLADKYLKKIENFDLATIKAFQENNTLKLKSYIILGMGYEINSEKSPFQKRLSAGRRTVFQEKRAALPVGGRS